MKDECIVHEFIAYQLRHCFPPKLDGRVISHVYMKNVDGKHITIRKEILQ